jgi:hypothetical protein
MGKMIRAGAGAGIFDKLEPVKNGPAPQHCLRIIYPVSTCPAGCRLCLRGYPGRYPVPGMDIWPFLTIARVKSILVKKKKKLFLQFTVTEETFNKS